jgi:hypothetical protein
VRARPDADTARDLSAPHPVAETLGEGHHGRLHHPQ